MADKHRRLNRPFNEAIFREQAGVWSGTLEIGFVRPGDGWVKVDEAFNPHSMLQMPHEAPVEGYRGDSWSRYIHSRESMNEISTSNPTYGYFLRTRVELDAAGNVESAHYAKLVGEIGFYPTGKVWTVDWRIIRVVTVEKQRTFFTSSPACLETRLQKAVTESPHSKAPSAQP
ncbi:MAG: hypothetical protein ACFE0O_13055 [Opitutales bacterium]